MKKDSIVRKQMLLYMTTIGILILLLCGALAVIYTNHYMGEKKEELIGQGEKIATAYSKAYRTGNLGGNLSVKGAWSSGHWCLRCIWYFFTG